MKALFITLLLFMLSVNIGFGQVRVDTMEAHRLWMEGKQLELKENFYRAAEKFRAASKIFYEQNFKVRYADCISSENICVISMQSSFLSDSLLQKSLNIYVSKLGEDHIKLVRVLLFLGIYNVLQKNYDRSYNYQKWALKILTTKINNIEKPPKRFAKILIKIFNGLGWSFEMKKEYSRANMFYKKGLLIAKNFNVKQSVVSGYMNLAGIQHREKRYKLAVDNYKKAIQASNKSIEGPAVNIAGVYIKLKELKKSERYYNIALDIAKKRYKRKHPSVSSIYYWKGVLSEKQGNLKKALLYIQKALYYNSDNITDSANIFNQEVSAYQSYKLAFLQITLLKYKATILKTYVNKLEYLLQALYNYQICDTIINNIKLVKPGLYDYYVTTSHGSKLYKDASNLCQELFLKTRDQYYHKIAFYFAEKIHSSFLAKSLYARKAKLIANLPDSITNKELYLQRQTGYFQRQLLTIKDSIKKETYQDSLFKYARKREILNEVLAQNFPKYYRLRFQNTPATVAQIQQKLDTQTVLLNYDFGKERSRVFVVTKDTFQVVPLAKQSDVTKVLNDYYNALQNETDLKTFAAKSYEVYKALFEPVKAFLQGKQKLVITNPTLLSVPLGAVLDQRMINPPSKFSQLPYLIKKHAISYHYSASLWLQSQEGESITLESKRSFIGMAPFSGGESKVVTTRGDQGLLPESKKEINAIYNFFKKKNLYAEAYLAKAATKQRFLNRLKDFDILHIASHSTANLREERLAKIHFAPQTHPDSTYLYAESIYYLPLKAQLVVLSSCESGVGKFAPGEGVMSLARGFLHAGAKNVISSLWEADDQYTKKLMVLLYQQILFRHKTYTQALHTAKNQLIAQEPYLHPKYWSNFILIGR